MTDGLASWVDELRDRYGTMRQIAELIGMSESGFTRGVKRGTLSIENLLDLARATDTAPSEVLRRAGKGNVAELIERLYGPGRDALKESQREVLDLWDAVDDDEGRQAVLVTLRIIASPRGGQRGVGSKGSLLTRKGTGKTATSIRRTRRPSTE